MNHRENALEIFGAAVAAVQPARLFREHLALCGNELLVCGQAIPFAEIRRLFVVGAGKATAAMAVEAEHILGDLITAGLVVTKYGHALPTSRIQIWEAAHPVPDEHSAEGVKLTLQLLADAGAADVVLCLLSGGASALWCDVPVGLTLEDMQKTFNLLLRSGAAIDEMNAVRKHLSDIKGGQFIRHCGGARVFTLMISDVPYDDPGVIASGPTVPDTSTFADVKRIIQKYRLETGLPTCVLDYLRAGLAGHIPETPKPGDELFHRVHKRIIGSNKLALQAAQATARSMGYNTLLIKKVITGDAFLEARKLVSLAQSYGGAKPVCILQGGETTVKVTGSGKGGRNQHFVLAALQALATPGFTGNILVLSAGTDGTDGPTDATGAIAGSDTLQQAAFLQLDMDGYLANNDAYHFFEKTGNLVITGATGTNVMDVMMAIGD